MNYGSNALANWLWKDLYVWPEGRMAPSAYLGALLRILIVYLIFAQVLTFIGPALTGTFNSKFPMDMFELIKWGQTGAVVLIAFPVWSVFQRRFNDLRPDLREKLNPWIVGFPLLLSGLILLLIAHAAGYQIPFDDAGLGRIRFWFAAALFGVAFFPGGDTVPVQTRTKPGKPQPDMFQTATQKANRESLAAQIATKPAGRHLPTAHTDRPKPALTTNFPPVIQRTRDLPQDGRVKPGWFS